MSSGQASSALGGRTRASDGELPAQPLLSGLYHVMPLGPDRVQIANAGRSVVLSGEGIARRVLPLLEALDGTAPLDDLGQRFPELVPDVLQGLAAKGLLLDGSGAEGELSGGPARAALALGHGVPAQAIQTLAGATVAVTGCGPVGSTVAALLGKARVGRLVLSDASRPSADEAAASPVLFGGEPGATRAEAARAMCRSVGDAQVDLAPVPRTGGLPDGIDLAVIEVCYEIGDRPSPDADACLLTGVPYVVHGQDALEAVVGPFVRPPASPCHCCAQRRRSSNVDRPDEYVAYRLHRAEAAPGPDAFLAAHSAVVAGVVASQALEALVGGEPPCERGMLAIDLAEMTIEREEVLPVPGCPSCDGAAGVAS